VSSSTTTPSEPDDALAKLVDHSLEAAQHISGLSLGPGLRALIAQMEQTETALLAERDRLRDQIRNAPPVELVRALRRPAGAPCLVRLPICGRRASVVVNPIGRHSPERETAVWKSLTSYFEGRAA